MEPTVIADHGSRPDWDGHLLLLHDSDAERLAGLTAWVRRGLDRDEKVIYTEAPDVAPEQSLLAILDERGLDVTAATADGRLTLLPLEEFYPPAGQATVIERALAEGFRAVRMSAEANAARSVLPEPVYADMERTMDQLCRTLPVSAMCQYARRATTRVRLREVVAAHLVGVRQTKLRTGQDQRGITFSGQVDVANADTFAAAVHAAISAAARVAWLDLGGVEFMDAAACRALAGATWFFRDRGGQVLLMAPQPSVERTLRLLDVDQLRGFELIGGDP
jgi:anti-anti-sigma factor